MGHRDRAPVLSGLTQHDADLGTRCNPEDLGLATVCDMVEKIDRRTARLVEPDTGVTVPATGNLPLARPSSTSLHALSHLA
jgi:hypothetical protein